MACKMFVAFLFSKWMFTTKNADTWGYICSVKSVIITHYLCFVLYCSFLADYYVNKYTLPPLFFLPVERTVRCKRCEKVMFFITYSKKGYFITHVIGTAEFSDTSEQETRSNTECHDVNKLCRNSIGRVKS